ARVLVGQVLVECLRLFEVLVVELRGVLAELFGMLEIGGRVGLLDRGVDLGVLRGVVQAGHVLVLLVEIGRVLLGLLGVRLGEIAVVLLLLLLVVLVQGLHRVLGVGLVLGQGVGIDHRDGA